jgi:transcriptional regulator with XRE-family HTH domain
MSKITIRSDILKKLREDLNLSQAKLAEKAHLSQKTISNLERGYENRVEHSANNHTTSQLEKILRTEKSILSGEQPIPEKPKNKETSISLSPKVQLNYDLVSKYYGITEQDILDVAPLLFFIAAERSLDKQLEDLKLDANNGNYLDSDDIDERFHAYFSRDIFERDIFENNPFTNFLENELSEPRFKSQIEGFNTVEQVYYGYVHYLFSKQIPDYLVCKELFSELTLNNDVAKKALQDGIVRVTELPHELLDTQKGFERVKWIEKEFESRKNQSQKNK